MAFYKLEFYQTLSGFWKVELFDNTELHVYLDKTETISGDEELINFRQILNKQKFIASGKEEGYVNREVKLLDIKKCNKIGEIIR